MRGCTTRALRIATSADSWTSLPASPSTESDLETCKVFGRERGRLRAARTPIADFDLLIGATALRYDLTLLTNNRRDFEVIQGLQIESQ